MHIIEREIVIVVSLVSSIQKPKSCQVDGFGVGEGAIIVDLVIRSGPVNVNLAACYGDMVVHFNAHICVITAVVNRADTGKSRRPDLGAFQRLTSGGMDHRLHHAGPKICHPEAHCRGGAVLGVRVGIRVNDRLILAVSKDVVKKVERLFATRPGYL